MTNTLRDINESIRKKIAHWKWIWPKYEVIENIAIAPFNRFSRKIKMNLPCDPVSHLLQHDHFEYNLNETIGRIEFIDLDREQQDLEIISDPVIYGGPLFTHFGHFIAESTHRIWPRAIFPELSSSKVAFVNFQKSRFDPFIFDGLALKGVVKEDIVMINRPTLFEKLIVPKQARQMSGATLNRFYKYIYEDIVGEACPPSQYSDRVYVSRSRHSHTGSYYGENYVEKSLAASGFDIIYPEDYSLGDLVVILRNTKVAVFAEGSAIHALELCGARIPKVFVIGRRPPSTLRWAPLVGNIAPKWKIYDKIIQNFGMSPDIKKHSAFLDVGDLLREIGKFCKLPVRPGAREAVEAEVMADIEAHIAQFATEDSSERADEVRELARTCWLRISPSA